MRIRAEHARISYRAGQQCIREYAKKSGSVKSTSGDASKAKDLLNEKFTQMKNTKPPVFPSGTAPLEPPPVATSITKGSAVPKGSGSEAGAKATGTTKPPTPPSGKKGGNTGTVLTAAAFAGLGTAAYLRYCEEYNIENSLTRAKNSLTGGTPPPPATPPGPAEPVMPKFSDSTGAEKPADEKPVAEKQDVVQDTKKEAPTKPKSKSKSKTEAAPTEPPTEAKSPPVDRAAEPKTAPEPAPVPEKVEQTSTVQSTTVEAAPGSKASEPAQVDNLLKSPPPATVAEEPAAAVQPPPPPPGLSPSEDASLKEALSPEQLVMKALTKGAETDAEFAAMFKAMQYQATVDSAAFDARLELIEEKHKEQLMASAEKSHTLAQLAMNLKESLKMEAEMAAEALKKVEADAAIELEAKLEAQALAMDATAMAEANLEREKRIQALDPVREELNFLSATLHSQAYESHQSHSVHKLSLGSHALDSAIQSGDNYLPILCRLSQSRPHDALVAAALKAVPAEVAAAGATTRTQLLERFVDVKNSARELSLLPPSGGGPVTLAVARIASIFRVEVPSRMALKGGDKPVGGIEDVLARTQHLVSQGELARAADCLEEGTAGTAAADVCSDWVKAVRARAVAEQTAALIHAHATTLAASLS